jgi:hypothetical protein
MFEIEYLASFMVRRGAYFEFKLGIYGLKLNFETTLIKLGVCSSVEDKKDL